MTRTVAVVGGGIAGLAAAWELVAGPGARGDRIVVLEASDRLGGKIRTGEVAGRAVDLGPDAFLARRPEAVGLAREVGLGEELVAPALRRAYVWSRGRLRPLPDGLALGVPTRLGPVLRSGILSPAGIARAGLDLVALTPSARPGVRGGAGGDRAIGDIVGKSLGHEVVDRFVDPLIGGINAGPVATMSAAAVYPPLLEAAARGGSLFRALRALAPAQAPAAAASGTAPVFLAPRHGVGALVEALAGALTDKGVELRCRRPVSALARHGPRWHVVGGDETLEADCVVMAAPAPVAAALLAPTDGELGRLLHGIDYATVAVLTYAVPAGAVGRVLDGTGFLVPAVEGWLTTACTWMTAKWAHLARSGEVVLRASVGRFGDDRAVTMTDDDLAARVWEELTPVLSLAGTPTDVVVTRWPGAFPQYAVGHLDLVARIDAAAATLGGLSLAGAA
ncbi:MAG TPA: protoporphyrinogen oxidase, partial [Candidatus Sulfotelmatobacter sp.]|nr:protoporphyrinogen oxidase [Candidatus Sulfotelmatobacter sp.]